MTPPIVGGMAPCVDGGTLVGVWLAMEGSMYKVEITKDNDDVLRLTTTSARDVWEFILDNDINHDHEVHIWKTVTEAELKKAMGW